ncbi:MAG: hypothetical protein ACP5QR_15970 [Rhizomicrobium sp.]
MKTIRRSMLVLGAAVTAGGLIGAQMPARAAPANPCAATQSSSAVKANPCAAKANPCAAKANPCAAKANPCAAKANKPHH